MARIGSTRNEYNGQWEDGVCLNGEECTLILPVVKRLRKRLERRHEYYEGIHEGGEATSRQETALVNAENSIELLDNIIDAMQRFGKEENVKRNQRYQKLM